MKKVLLIGLAIILALAVTACEISSDNSAVSSSPSVSPVASPSPEVTPSAEPNMMVGTLCAVFSADDIREVDFGYEEGMLTPIDIADALSDLTGLNFKMDYEIDPANNTVTVDWAETSSLATGQPPEIQDEDYFFFDVVSLRWFMLNSMCTSIRENLGDMDVFYSVNGGDMNELELDVDFNPAIAYNKIEDPNVIYR